MVLVRYLASFVFFLLISSAESAENDWTRLENSESPIQIIGEETEVERKCDFKEELKGIIKKWRCIGRGSDYSYLVYFGKYSFGGFKKELRFSDIFQKIDDGKINFTRNDPSFYHSGYDLLRVNSSGTIGYVFKNQDHLEFDDPDSAYGLVKFQGAWIIYGIYIPQDTVRDDALFAKQFVGRIDIDDVVKGKSPRASGKTTTRKKDFQIKNIVRKNEDAQGLEEKLIRLKKLYEKGLIPEQLYLKKVEAILK